MKKNGFKSRLVFAMITVVVVICSLNLFLYKAAYENQSEDIFNKVTQKVEDNLTKKLEERARNLISILSAQVFNPIYTHNFVEIEHLLESNLTLPDVLSIQIIDDSGLIFHDGTSDIVAYGQPHKSPSLIQQVLTQQVIITRSDDRQLVIAGPITQDNVQLGVIYIELSKDSIAAELTANKENLNLIGFEDQSTMFKWQLIFMLFSVLFGIVMAYRLSSSFARPLVSIISQIRKIEQGRLKAIDVSTKDYEFSQLVSAFNDMHNSVNRHTDHIEYMAYHDRLTGLPNRLHFIDLCDKLISHKEIEQVSVLFIDIDDFKHINDNYGHTVGDSLILTISERIKQLTLSSAFVSNINSNYECVLSRVGGDEFLLAIPHDKSTRITAITNSLLAILQQPIEFDEFKFNCTLSVGIACYPDFGNNAEVLSRRAELAMFQIKKDGKNAYGIFTHEMNESIEKRLYIERELRNAMDDLSQFELWYQPKFDMASRDIIGAEALVRWNHPTQGYIGPDQFIPVAESSDMILTLSAHLIVLAAEQASKWRAITPQNFYIALNLSPRQLHRQNVVSLMAKELAKYGLPPSVFHVEVTESLLLTENDHVKNVLNQFADMGIKVWLDDFGTGYSSLSYLQKYRFDGVKIDRSFISNLSPGNSDTALVEAVLTIAQSLKMDTVAEGIETEHQLELLNRLGCKNGQGYFIGKPVPAVEFDRHLTAPLQPQSSAI